ncbi:MAG: hypothetical protein FWD71_21670 [Oscillospiraceae bacterium]|nr:hypothetical protein [Oscillospiraceae bacterium]
MSYIERDIITPIIEFLKTCPFLEKYNIDMSEIDIGKFKDKTKPSSMLEYTGSPQVQFQTDITGNARITRQANYQLYLLKRGNDNLYRKDITLFIDNFEQWIDYCQVRGTTPKIGSKNFKEIMKAENGMFFDDIPTGEGGFMQLNQYMIQLSILYMTEIKITDLQ